MASIEDLKRQIDLHDLAEKLGLERPQQTGNYRSPHHKDKNPSLSIFDGGRRWKDWSEDAGGTCIDLVCYVEECDVATAIRRLHEIYSIPLTPRTPHQEPPRPKTLPERIADACLGQAEGAREYLRGRGISDAVIDRAIRARTLGWNTWRSTQRAEGEFGYGGEAAAFIVRSMNPGHVVAVDMRYVDPELNGGVKTQTQGEKQLYPYVSDLKAFQAAQTVVIVESPINALSVETCGMPYTAALATRGTGNVANIDWRALCGKRVLVCMDNDAPDDKGRSAGREAAWRLHEILTALNISALLVDQDEWEANDVNDILQAGGPDELRQRLKTLEPWLIAGLPGESGLIRGRSRVYLPPHDYAQYWRYRVKEDFVSYVTKREGGDEGEDRMEFSNLCGFRVAAISRIQIASVTAMMTGDPDTQPRTIYAVAVQTPRYGAELQRKVFTDEDLFNVDAWRKYAGPVYAPASFQRMVNILERTVHLGERRAVNFVGLAWCEGKPIVNEGPDCYFTNPDQQCPYHNLRFPSGAVEDARRVVDAYQATFRQNAAALALVWALGGHLKAFLGFWPHMIMQADKGAGKSTLVKHIERSIAFTMYSGQSLQTEFRLLTSISHTSHPVGWEEISARRQDVIDRAVGLLQEAYNYSVTRRGSEMTEYLVSAPVLLAGEDVPVKSLLGKVVRTELTDRKATPIPDDLPRFPVFEWLKFLSGYSRAQVRQLYQETLEHTLEASMAAKDDDSARRMAGNYAALITAWRLLCEFAEIPREQGRFVRDCIQEMNTHIGESAAVREPWVWIMETLVSEIDSHGFRHPYAWREIEGEMCLVVRPSNIMDHISQTMSLRDKWNALPVKSSRVLVRQLARADVVVSDRVDVQVKGKRYYHMTGIGVERLARFGLHATPEDPPPLEGWDNQ